MLEIRDLTVSYGRGHDVLDAVGRISISVPSQGTLGLVGESGSGKSTLARAIVGLVPVAGGQILVDGTDWTSPKRRATKEYRRLVQMVFQDPQSSLNPRMTINEMFSEALSTRGIPRQQHRRESLKMLEVIRMPADTLERYPHQFSGGQRQRLAIGRALAVQPQVIILDEVTSALDVSVQASILNLLNDIQRELRLSFLLISHDLAVIGMMSEFVAVMYLGRVVEQGPSTNVFASPEHPYTRGLIGSIPVFGSDRIHSTVIGSAPDPRHPPPGCRFHTRCAVGPLSLPDREVCKTSDPQATAQLRVHDAACHFARMSTVSETSIRSPPRLREP